MSDSKTPEELSKEIQSLLKDKLGLEVLGVTPGGMPPGATAGATPEGDEPEAPPVREDAIPDEIESFNMRPAEVKAHLDRFVIGQDEAKRTLAVAVCDHYNHVRRYLQSLRDGPQDTSETDDTTTTSPARPVEYVKQNVILLGPTGVGKTYLIRHLAQLIGVPFVKGDSTKFSETGYVGGDVEDMVRELYRTANGDARLAEHGIIFLDEVDKIAATENSQGGRDPSGRGVQVALLKLMEETEVPMRNPMDISSQFQDMFQGQGLPGQGGRPGAPQKRTINTKHVLFVVSGAFSGLGEIVAKRLSKQSIGFGSVHDEDVESSELLARAVTKDFVDYGFEPEFVGRLPIRCALRELSADDLYDILKNSEGSILHQYRDGFRGYDIDVAVESDALREIAQQACDEKTGARGLMTVLERSLRDFKFYLPGTDVKEFAITADLIRDPRSVLKSLLESPTGASEAYARAAVREWEEAFADAHGVRLVLDEQAAVMAFGVSKQLERTLWEHLDATFGDHKDFLRKILEKSGRSELPVTPHILNNPAEGLELWLTSQAKKG